MMNSSLTYEILLYLNSFYFGMFMACEFGIFVLKAVNLKYIGMQLPNDAIFLFSFFVLEAIRIYCGRAGSLSESGWRVIASVFLTIPCAVGVSYILIYSTHKLLLEYILCALTLALHAAEVFYAILFVITRCRPISYD